jgi:hypothetical protein
LILQTVVVEVAGQVQQVLTLNIFHLPEPGVMEHQTTLPAQISLMPVVVEVAVLILLLPDPQRRAVALVALKAQAVRMALTASAVAVAAAAVNRRAGQQRLVATAATAS